MRDDGADTKLEPIVNGWLAVVQKAIEAKKDFQEDADECLNFFSKNTEWLWDEKNPRKFWTGEVAPKFKMTVNKAFELVALFGPMLYHDNPVRTVTPREAMQFPAEAFGFPPEFLQYQMQLEQFQQMQQQYGMAMQQGPPPPMEGQPPMPWPPMPPQPPMPPPGLEDPMALQQMQMAYQQFQADEKAQVQQGIQDQFRAKLVQAYLNYTPNEMPGGGLRLHAQRAITEALLTGRGVMWTSPHTMPGGNSRLIVSEFDSVNNLLIDPDAVCLEDANFVIRKCTHPYWQLEQDYPYYEPGELKEYANLESKTAQGMSSSDPDSDYNRKNGKANDLVTYYKIWSKMGIGARLAGIDEKAPENQKLDAAFGDYCYIVIVPGIPFPLNLPPHKVQEGDDIVSMLAWEVPYYADERWPCTALDFYAEPANCVWPKSPLSPGLGWLKFINVMISSLANKIWTTQRTLIGVRKGCSEAVKEALEKGSDLEVIEVSDAEGGKIDACVSFLQVPDVQGDVWKILDAAMEEFKRTTGLNDLLSGLPSGGAQSRSAADAQAKQQGVNIRPDFMAKQVEAWAAELSRKEAMCARFYIEASDIQLVLGPQAATLWQTIVADQDVEKVVRELEYRIESGSSRKPNKDQMIANSNQVMQQLTPMFFQYMIQTGNPGPVNSAIEFLGKAIDMPTQGMMLAPPPPPPPMPPQEAQNGPPSNQ